MAGTGGLSTDVHVLSKDSGYQSFSLNAITAQYALFLATNENFEVERPRSVCPLNFEVEIGNCLHAVKKLAQNNGWVVSPNLEVVENDSHPPHCSVFIGFANLRILGLNKVHAVYNHLNDGNEGIPAEQVCKRQVTYDIEVRTENQCPIGLKIPQHDCYYAGLAILGKKGIAYKKGLIMNTDGASCGCYISNTNGDHTIHYNSSGSCTITSTEVDILCKKPVKYIMPNLDPLRCLGRDSENLTLLDCNADSTDHKWFFEIDKNEMISLWTRTNENEKYCLEKDLSIKPKSNEEDCAFEWIFLQNGQIQNSVGRVIEYDSTNNILSLQDIDKLNQNQKWFISDHYVTKQSEFVDARYKGSYQNGIFFQDNTGFVKVDNDEVHLYGNSWKIFEFQEERVYFRTKFQFKYRIVDEAEGHFACFGYKYHRQVSKEFKRNCITLSGNNNDIASSPYLVQFENGWKHVSISIFEFLQTETLTPKIDYVAFIQDSDQTPWKGHSEFTDFRISTIEMGTPSFSCNSDFIAVDTVGMKPTRTLTSDTDFCVSSDLPSLVSYSNTDPVKVQFDTRGISLHLKLYQRENNEDMDVVSVTKSIASFDVATKDFAGQKFVVKQVNDGNNEEQELLGFISKCSGKVYEDTNDLTGAPRNFNSFQSRGHVRFTFEDNSLCEDGFAFARFEDPSSKEFLRNVFDHGVTFSPIFYFSGEIDYGEIISPETEASDDLTISSLGVGEKYGYCVRAVHRESYMDTMDVTTSTISTKTSSSTCHVHRIRWESSISGKVTTEPNAGTLPIKHVKVDYELITEDTNEPIDCDVCSGTVYTDDGGSFNIEFNVDHPLLKGKGDTSIPVKLKYSKVTKFGGNTIDHVFLCNNGLEFCDNGGNLVYLKHLHFEEPVHVYDDTSVPFRGKLFYHNTRFPGSEGCPVVDAEVCLVHHTTASTDNTDPSDTTATSLTKYDLVCVKSNTFGEYNAPIIMGSEVHEVNVRHKGHEFGKSLHNRWNYKNGIVITDSEVYSGHDFMDISKATLRVEVVGGECSKSLGSSRINVKIDGCDWHGDSYDYTGVRSIYNNVPPTLVKVQVTSNEYPHIESYFQNGDSPRTESIDLTDEHIKEDSVEDGRNEILSTDSNLQEQADEATSAEEDQVSLVRFQYDGTLAMDVQITSGTHDIPLCDSSTFVSDILAENGGDSFYVTDKAANVEFTVMLKFDLIKTDEQNISCDIVGDDYTVTLMNNIGGECSEGCSLKVEHDIDEDEKKIGGARATLELADEKVNQFEVGEPNILYPYTKNIFFQVSGNGASVSHNAHFFIQGLFSKGPGKSFALPNFQPVMILRDPPGGLSYAKFENVMTNMKIVQESTTVSMGTGIGITPKVGLDDNSKGCVGLGAMFCKDGSKTKLLGGLGASGSIGGDVKDYEEEKSNSFSTTWSYTTSTSPDKAGPMSDIFVIPNLFVAVTTYTIVAWDYPESEEDKEGKCKPYQNENDEFPTFTDFTIDNENTALSFFSRHHIKTVKIPELEAAKVEKENERDNMMDGDGKFKKECCEDPPCQSNKKESCSQDYVDKVQAKLDALENALDEWNNILNTTADAAEITEFFGSENPFIQKMNSEGGRLRIKNHPSGLVPDDYTTNYCGNGIKGNGFCEDECHFCNEDGQCIDEREERIDPNPKNKGEEKRIKVCPALKLGRYIELQEEFNKSINTNRMQFSGGGSVFEMTLNHDYGSSKSGLSCWHGCGVDHETELTYKIDTDAKFFGFGVGTEVEGTILSLHTVHKSHKGNSIERATTVSYGFGDEHTGDEFVVDVNFDKKYGTFVFDTVAGISRCPHEEGTLPAEDPQLNLLQSPSPYVDPETPMLFEIEIANLGEGEGNFQLEAVQGKDYLVIVVDGTEITEAGTSLTVPRHDSKVKTVALHRDPIAFHYDPIKMFLKTCDSPREGASDVREIELFNDYDGAEKTISFLQPCPKISWAGDLQRDRRFVLNTDSYKRLTIDIFNNERIGGTLNETKAERRLETVGLKYRQVGDVNWSDAFTTINDENFDLNFVSDQIQRIENNYGYSSLEWNTEYLQEGAYEIMVESDCVQVDGSPDLSRFREEIIVGVKDTIRPKQYGKALPLKDDILFGEEMTVLFSEKIDCSYPFKFDVTLEIKNFYNATSEACVLGNGSCHLKLKKSNNDLQISCEGRKIGLIPDISILGDVEKFLGKSFHVEIGNEGGGSLSHVFDVNGNKLEHNVEFDKSFLALDLYTITAKIDVTIDSCPDWVTSGTESEKTTELAVILGLKDSSRIKISSQICSEGKASFILLITPPSDGRRLRNLFQKDSMSDLDSLKFLSKLREMNNHRIVNGRYLQKETQQVKITLVEIIPGKEDRIRLETPVELLREERHLQKIMSFEGDIHHIRENELPDDIVRNSKEEQSQIELLLMEQQKKMEKIETLEEKMEAMRKEDAEKMEEMRKEDARALKEMQQKEHEEIKEVFMASIAIVVGTVVMIGGAMFLHFRRS